MTLKLSDRTQPICQAINTVSGHSQIALLLGFGCPTSLPMTVIHILHTTRTAYDNKSNCFCCKQALAPYVQLVLLIMDRSNSS